MPEGEGIGTVGEKMTGDERAMNKELAECAKINFENFERSMLETKFLDPNTQAFVHGVASHPYYRIAKAQLDEALGYGTVEETLLAELAKTREGG